MKSYIENQNYENVLIANQISRETEHDGTCNENSAAEPLPDNDFINWDSMTEAKNKIDECDEELHQNFIVNTPVTTDSQNFEIFKIGKNPTNITNARTNSKNTKQNSTKLEPMKIR